MVIELIKPEEIEKFVKLRDLFIHVFDEQAPALNETQYAQIRDNRNFVAIGATVGFDLVGGIAGHLVPNYYKGGLDLFIYDVAVKHGHRRKGIGSELMKFAIQFCKEHGIKEMYVSADQEDDHALAFYRKTNPSETSARFFNYSIQP